MSIEAGARCGMVAVDERTVEYVRGRPFAPAGELWDRAVDAWRELHSDADASFDRVVTMDAGEIRPQMSWGTSPELVLAPMFREGRLIGWASMFGHMKDVGACRRAACRPGRPRSSRRAL